MYYEQLSRTMFRTKENLHAVDSSVEQNLNYIPISCTKLFWSLSHNFRSEILPNLNNQTRLKYKYI